MMLLVGAVSTLDAKVELPPVFADNMVLQQQTQAAVWGRANPNAKIRITTTWSKDKTEVTADENGKWFARIETPQAGGPYEITFNDGDKLTLKATGYLNDKATGVSSMTLAEFTEAKDSVMYNWSAFDLSKLGAVDEVTFEVVSTNSSVPGYVCIDGVLASIDIRY